MTKPKQSELEKIKKIAEQMPDSPEKQGETAMSEELNQELQKGKEAAKVLVEHLYMMSAEQCQIQVEYNGISYVCDVRMKIQPKTGRFTFKGITFEGHVIEEIEEIEYMQVKEVLAGDIRKIGDQYIVINDNIPVIAIVSDVYLKKIEQALKG